METIPFSYAYACVAPGLHCLNLCLCLCLYLCLCRSVNQALVYEKRARVLSVPGKVDWTRVSGGSPDTKSESIDSF